MEAGRFSIRVDVLQPSAGSKPPLITVDGLVIGAVGCSGATSSQDAQVATAGIAALVK